MRILEKYEIVKQDGKYGLKYYDGSFVLEPIYDLIEKWVHSGSYYLCSGDYDIYDIPELYIVIKDKKIGFADTPGIVVKPEYDNLLREDFMYSEALYPVFVAEKNGLYGYIDKYGKPITDFIYKDVEFPLIGPIAHVVRKNEIGEFISLLSGKTFFETHNAIISGTSRTHIVLLIDNKRYKIFDKHGNAVADFLNNDKLNSCPVRYVNDKLLMYFIETNVKFYPYKIGLLDYTGKILTDTKYSNVTAIAGTSKVVCTNLLGDLDEIVDENGNIMLSQIKNVQSFNGLNFEGMLIPPLVYWNAEDDPTDFTKCLTINDSIIPPLKDFPIKNN